MGNSILEQGFSKYAPAFLCMWGSGMLLTPSASLVAMCVGAMLVQLWVYLVHRGVHLLPDVIAPLNTHVTYHHEPPPKSIHRVLELVLEFALDMSMILSLWGVQWLTGLTVVPTAMILLFALAYSSVHLIQYSLLGSEIHRIHHEREVYNYSPDSVDYMFGTKYGDDLENTNWFIPNILGSLLVLWPFRELVRTL